MKNKIFIIFSIMLLFGNPSAGAAEETFEWKECVKEANVQHPDLLSAADNIKQLKAAKEVTRSVMLPQVFGNASEVTSNSRPFLTTSGSTVESETSSSSSSKKNYSTTYDYGITGQQLLFDGFKSSYDLSGSERNIWSSRYNYDVTSSNIRMRLRTAFVNLLTAQELLKVTEEIEMRRKQNLELVKLKYEGGREHKGSLMTSEADLAQALYDVDQARRSIYLSQRRLTKELGRSYFIPMSAAGELGASDQVRDRPDFERIAETTPLLQQLIAKKEAARFGLKSAYADFFPQVYANASLSNSNTDAFPDKNEWSIGTQLTIPFFDGGNRFAAVSQAKAVLGQASENERSGRDGVILTLSDTWTQLQNAVENVGVQLKFLQATEVRAKIARSEYAIGLMLYDNWIIIENNLVSAQKSYVNAQAAASIAEATWIQAKGGTLDYDQVQ
jgi:outer membrane protein TolC